jgi:hypothetical protein
VTNQLLLVADEVEILARFEIDVDQRVFLVRQSSERELAVKSDENPGGAKAISFGPSLSEPSAGLGRAVKATSGGMPSPPANSPVR